MAKRLLTVLDRHQNEEIRRVDITDMSYYAAERLRAYVRRQLSPERYSVLVGWYETYIKTPTSEGPKNRHLFDAWHYSPDKTQWFSGAKSFWDTKLGKPFSSEET